MSDQEPEYKLPDYLTEAILSEGPPADATDLIKNAFSWRTFEAELLELSFDSTLAPVGVRDPDATRTLELTGPEMSVVLEVGSDGRVAGQVVPPSEGTAVLEGLEASISTPIGGDGRFVFTEVIAGPVRLRVSVVTAFTSPTFNL